MIGKNRRTAVTKHNGLWSRSESSWTFLLISITYRHSVKQRSTCSHFGMSLRIMLLLLLLLLSSQWRVLFRTVTVSIEQGDSFPWEDATWFAFAWVGSDWKGFGTHGFLVMPVFQNTTRFTFQLFLDCWIRDSRVVHCCLMILLLLLLLLWLLLW